MITVRLYAQHYEWLSDDIRAEMDWILQTGGSDDRLLDCAYDIAFIKAFSEEGFECEDDNEVLALGKRVETMVRKYDENSDIKLRIICGAGEKEAVVTIYEL